MINHLWQSTIFAIAAAMQARAFQSNHARVRYWIWLAASIKFLLPFTLLADLGTRLHWRTAAPAVIATMMERARDFAAPIQSAATLPATSGPSFPWTNLWIALWACGVLAVLGWWTFRWRAALRTPVLEPGVFGLLRPVVKMPHGIDRVLTPAQLAAIVAHENAHVRWRDNLTAALHMAVEAIFWFHPFVWWIGSRLIDERERACDEEVVRQGHARDAYAEAILRVCRAYLESPVTCVPGVTGSNLKQRIQSILEDSMPGELNCTRKMMLVASAAVVLAAPLLIGVWNAPPLQAQAVQLPTTRKFEVATIKPTPPGANGVAMGNSPSGDFIAVNQTLENLVALAYTGASFSEGRVTGGPGWVRTARFDIVARPGSTRSGDAEEMLRSLLAERFALKVHEENRDLGQFALVAKNPGKLGPNLHATDAAEAAHCDELEKQPPESSREAGAREPEPSTGPVRRCGANGNGGVRMRGRPLTEVTEFLEELLGKPVVDRTGLAGRFDADLLIKLDWNHLVEGGVPDTFANGAIFAALEDQLGLKLESARGPVKVVVIDSAERPAEN